MAVRVLHPRFLRKSGSYIVITKSQFVSVFRNRLAHMGVHDPSRFRGHWAFDAYKCYLEFSDDAKLRVARKWLVHSWAYFILN